MSNFARNVFATPLFFCGMALILSVCHRHVVCRAAVGWRGREGKKKEKHIQSGKQSIIHHVLLLKTNLNSIPFKLNISLSTFKIAQIRHKSNSNGIGHNKIYSTTFFTKRQPKIKNHNNINNILTARRQIIKTYPETMTATSESAASNLQSVIYSNENGEAKLSVLDQLLVPHEKKYIPVPDVEAAWSVIRLMQIRG